MLKLTIASPEKSFFSGSVVRIALPGVMGGFEIRNNHAPFMSLLKTGTIIAYPQKEAPIAICIESGFAQVNDNVVSILVDTAFNARLHEHEALLSKQNEYRQKLTQHDSNVDYAVLLKELAQLSSELNAIDRIRKYRNKT